MQSIYILYSSALHICAYEIELHKYTNKLYSKRTIVKWYLFPANLVVNGLQLLLLTGCYGFFLLEILLEI